MVVWVLDLLSAAATVHDIRQFAAQKGSEGVDLWRVAPAFVHQEADFRQAGGPVRQEAAHGYDLGLVFFAINSLLTGVLIWVSGLFPRIIGAGIAAAGAGQSRRQRVLFGLLALTLLGVWAYAIAQTWLKADLPADL